MRTKTKNILWFAVVTCAVIGICAWLETTIQSGGSAVSRKEFLGLAMLGAVGAARPRLTRGPMIAMMGGGSKGPTARDYVQDGLIAMWDGIENAGWGVHDPNAKVWKDLAGNYDLTIDNDSDFEWEEKSIRFNGYSHVWNSATGVPDLKSLEIVFLWESQVGYATILGGLRGQVGIVYTGGVFTFGVDTQPRPVITVSKNVITSVARSTYEKVYKDGSVIQNPKLETHSFGNSGSHVRIGSWEKTRFLIGNVYAVRFYSRAITDAEVASNYAIDKVRFRLA